MRVKIEDMRDWLRDYYFEHPEELEGLLGDDSSDEEKVMWFIDEMSCEDVAEEYVRLKFDDKK